MIKNLDDLPEVFTEYLKKTEPLRERPRAVLPKPEKSSLPPLVEENDILAQKPPCEIPTTYKELEKAVLGPIRDFMPNIPPFLENCLSVHPFKGGEDFSYARLVHSLKSEIMVNYKGTRNGLMGIDCSTKLSAFLA